MFAGIVLWEYRFSPKKFDKKIFTKEKFVEKNCFEQNFNNFGNFFIFEKNSVEIWLIFEKKTKTILKIILEKKFG